MSLQPSGHATAAASAAEELVESTFKAKPCCNVILSQQLAALLLPQEFDFHGRGTPGTGCFDREASHDGAGLAGPAMPLRKVP